MSSSGESSIASTSPMSADEQTAEVTTDGNHEDLTFFGQVRKYINDSPFTGCGRQSMMWGIGTAAAMGLHRWRMGSRFGMIKNSFFGTVCLIGLPGYYLCTNEKIWKRQNIEVMMKASNIKPEEEMPEERSLDDHPFLDRSEKDDDLNSFEDDLMIYKKKEGLLWESKSGEENKENSSN